MKTLLMTTVFCVCATQVMAQSVIVRNGTAIQNIDIMPDGTVSPSQQATAPQDITPMPPAPAIAAASVAGGPTITWEKLCQELVTYQPSADVNFKPGTDVHGRPVVPADLQTTGGAGSLNLPASYRILLTTNQAQQMNLNIPNVQMNADAFIGQVIVSPNGDVTFNGQPVGNSQIQTMCSNLQR